MELLIYCFAYLLTIWFVLFPKSITGKYFFIIWFSFSVCLSLIIRSSIGSTESADIDGYIVNMKRDEILSYSYYFREPIFWFGIRFLYDLVGDGALVFVILDTMVFLLIYISFSICRKSFYPSVDSTNLNYLFFAALLFFPYVMGMHNIYRQLIATFIFLAALGMVGQSKIIRGYLISLIAVLIHNPIGIFLPVLVMSMKNNFFKYFSMILLAIILIIFQSLLQIDSSYLAREGSISIGRNIAYFYMISLVIILATILSFEFVNPDKQHSFFISIFFILTIIYSYSAFFFSSEQAQRMVFYTFGILFPFFGFYFESRFKPKILSRLILFHVSLVPLILIYNTTIDMSL